MPIRRDSRGRFAGGGGSSSKGPKLSASQRAKAASAKAGFGVRGTASGQSRNASSAGMIRKQQQAKSNGQQRAEALGSIKMASSNLRFRAKQAQRALPKNQGLASERSAAAKSLNKDRKALNEVRRQVKPKRWKSAK